MKLCSLSAEEVHTGVTISSVDIMYIKSQNRVFNTAFRFLDSETNVFDFLYKEWFAGLLNENFVAYIKERIENETVHPD